MRDSIELGSKIGEAVRFGTSIEQAFRAYEVDMVPRATESVISSRTLALRLSHGESADSAV